MKIIDAHHHLWNPTSNIPDVGYVWVKQIGAMKPFGDPTSIQRDYLLDEYRSESQRYEIIGSVHVQSDGAIADPIRETGFIHNIVDTSQFPMSIVGFVDLAANDAMKMIERHRASDCFRGVRQILSKLDDRPELSFASEHFIKNDAWRAQFALLAENALSFDLQCYPEQMADVAEFLSEHTFVPVVIDHSGSPYDQSTTGLNRWREGMSLFAQLPQVSVKLSGFGMFDQAWNVTSIRPLFESMYELFGANRLMFGSNYPVDKLMRPYDNIVSDIKLLCDEAGSGTADSVFRANAASFYGLDA